MTLLEVKDLYKSFSYPEKIKLFKGVSFTAKKGQTIAIMGASGEGKTTLLHILGALEDKDSGDIIFKETSIDLLPSYVIRRKYVGYIFQSYNLIEDLTALNNVLLPKKILGEKTKENYKKAYSLLDQVGLSKRADFPVRLLSGGEKQRVAIARSFINDPEIILADEPSGNLDHKTSEEVHTLLISFAKKFGKTLIVATHDKTLASLCDEIYLLDDGKLKKFH